MSQINRPYIGVFPPCPNYISLGSFQDDKTVLKNPHKGWYWHFIDNGYGRENYRQNLTPGDHMTDFPGLNHLYLRFDWGDIEKEEGVYDWSYIDAIMEEWGSAGYRFSFRICTYEGSAHPDSLKYATPKWVYDAGAKFISCDGGKIEPVYNDPVYLEKLEVFMKEYGRKFDMDDRVEFIDVGTFGTWGEGHTCFGSGTIYPNETLYAHMLLHAKYFPHKIIMLNDDMVGHRECRPEEEKQEIIELAKTLGFGARDDSICVSSYSQTFGYDTVRSPGFFDQLSPDAPVDIEYEHYTNVTADPDVFRDGFPFAEALKRVHATYAGFHGLPRPWLSKYPYLTEYLANRLGYWFFINGLRLTSLHAGCQNRIDLYFENRGFARAYHPYTFKLRLVDSNDQVVLETLPAVDCRRWLPGESVREAVTLNLTDCKSGRYSLQCGLFDSDRPVLFGMQPELYREGFYALSDIEVL